MMEDPTVSSPSTSLPFLRILIGSAASTKSLYDNQNSSNNQNDSMLSSLWIVTVALMIGGQYVGGWNAFFRELEQLVVPIYTGLVLMYLAFLIVVNTYRWFFPAKRVSTARHTKTSTTPPTISPTVPISADQPFDLSGAYKLVQNDNFEGFLAVQGVPWALRRAANQARPVHRITHRGNQLTIKIEGIIESQTTYTIDGPPVETNVRGRIFQDKVTYLEGDDVKGIQVSKTALTEDYDVTVQRVFSPDLQEITMTSRAVFRDGKDPVECVQKFKRVEDES